jgi:hypothetical protein
MSGIMKLLISQNASARTTAAAIRRAVNAVPRTGQLKSAAGMSRRARPSREFWAVGTLLAHPWRLELDLHTVGGQVESQPACL